MQHNQFAGIAIGMTILMNALFAGLASNTSPLFSRP